MFCCYRKTLLPQRCKRKALTMQTVDGSCSKRQEWLCSQQRSLMTASKTHLCVVRPVAACNEMSVDPLYLHWQLPSHVLTQQSLDGTCIEWEHLSLTGRKHARELALDFVAWAPGRRHDDCGASGLGR